MAEPKDNVQMEKIVSLCKRRGFIYQSSEIYGGINGFWDYGPLGAELKRHVKESWWRTMVQLREDVAGLDATIIMHPRIWKASGHVDTFADMMRECPLTQKRFRADQVEPQSGWVFTYAGAKSRAAAEISRTSETALEAARRILEMSLAQEQKDLELRKVEEQYGVEVANQIRKLTTRDFVRDSIKVLVPQKDARLADEWAARYYRHFCNHPVPEPAAPPEQVEASVDFNPEKGPGWGMGLTPPRPFNLMFKSHYGPVEDDENVCYLRPETAQAIFAQFKNVLETSRQKVPFGIAQIGKAFRNEVTPRNYTFRSREFEQMELEFFIRPDEVIEAICGSVAQPAGPGHPGEPQPNWGWQLWHQYWVEERIRFYESIGLPRHTLVEYWQSKEELAHYARATVDILYKFPFSKRDEKGELKGEELEGIAARGDFDLSQHERFSGKPMGVFDEELRAAWAKLDKSRQDELWKRYYDARKAYLERSGAAPEQAEKDATEDANGLAKGQYIPHVIEPSAGVDRLILALICDAFSEVTETDAKGKSESRVILRFHPRVAPIKVAVLPLLKNKPELVAKAREVFSLLRGDMNAFYDAGGSIGRRYARQDEAGTPFCVTIDFDTLGEKPELKDTVTLRYRDDGRQDRLPIGGLIPFLLAQVR